MKLPLFHSADPVHYAPRHGGACPTTLCNRAFLIVRFHTTNITLCGHIVYYCVTFNWRIEVAPHDIYENNNQFVCVKNMNMCKYVCASTQIILQTLPHSEYK